MQPEGIEQPQATFSTAPMYEFLVVELASLSTKSMTIRGIVFRSTILKALVSLFGAKANASAIEMIL
jgi:hypothetical protein